MRFLIALLAMLLFLALLGAQEKLVLKGDVREVEIERTVVVKDRVKVATLPVTITAPGGATDYRWKYPASITATDDDSETLEIADAPNGTLTVSVRMRSYSIVDGKIVVSAKTLQITFTVGEVVPPKPPEPKPNPAPIPGDGFRVLFVVESADAAKLPKEQLAILTSGEVRGYLNAKCAVGPDGKTREWRQWDQHISIEGESQLWADAMKRKRDSLPWIVISNGKEGFEGPLPKTIQDTLALLRKFGGN